MISINLNAIREWERVRSDTEPHTPDVDRNPGAEQSDPPELENGSHGVRRRPVVRRRHEREEQEHQDEHETDAYEVDIGHEQGGFGPPPDGEKAPIDSYQGRNVDVEA